ncbi:unnamed protein product, partial [Closterium sp. NIES-54]
EFSLKEITCPPDYSSCVIPQNASSLFCRQCGSFCTRCDKLEPTASPSQSEGSVSSGAITGIAVAGGVALLLLLLLLIWLLGKRCRTKSAGGGDTGTDGEGKDLANKSGLREPHDKEEHPVAAEGAATAAAAAAAAAPQRRQGDGAVVEVEAARPYVCQEYSLAELARATGEWAEMNKIGSGSFGDVYKGVSPHDCNQAWAVKRARVLTNDFQTEVKEMASKHHPHLVRLLGYCIDMDLSTRLMEQVLIYELMPNNDLDSWIGPGVSNPLSLRQRLDVLIGVAKGLQYLHDFGIVHRDIKPVNILLDAKMQACQKTLRPTLIFPFATLKWCVELPSIVLWAVEAEWWHCYGRVCSCHLSDGNTGLCGPCLLQVPQGHSGSRCAQVAPLVDSSAVASFKDPRLDAPDDLVLRLARLALSCTAMPVASRPSTSQVLGELAKMKQEMYGAHVSEAISCIDMEVESASSAPSFSAEIARAKRSAV